MVKRKASGDNSPDEGTYWHMDEAEWYSSVVEHWVNHVQAEDDNGVLGGYGSIDEVDTRGSLAFVESWRGGKTGVHAGTRALDCGAGIGRVTGGLLLQLCEEVQLVEVSAPLLATAQRNLKHASPRVEFTQASLREFNPPAGSYDLVWAQWILGHLTDRDVVALLASCRHALRPGGAVVVKDNNAAPADCARTGKRYALDEANHAVIRTYKHSARLPAESVYATACMARMGAPYVMDSVPSTQLPPTQHSAGERHRARGACASLSLSISRARPS